MKFDRLETGDIKRKNGYKWFKVWNLGGQKNSDHTNRNGVAEGKAI